MPIRYQNLGFGKRLTEIVFAGSHDASITSGSSNAQTQKLNIREQAEAGVRLFDLRILGRSYDGGKASLVGYHGSGGGKTGGGKSKGGGKSIGLFSNTVTGKVHEVQTAKTMKFGVFGLHLKEMLEQARAFVESTSEFLIFKFDKSYNYALIAEYCVTLLGDNIFKPIGIEFGKLTLDDLKKKVVCVFNDKALSEIKEFNATQGILGFRSLRGDKNSVGKYDREYPGLQYYGKGMENWKKIYQSHKMKMNDTISTQRKMLLAMARQTQDFAADVLGMMYWTTTGFLESIRERNENQMWGDVGVKRMGELWRQGLEASIETQLARDRIKVLEFGGVRRIKAYFPNIIMIDFADSTKCDTIYQLNTTVDQKLAKAYDKYVGQKQ